MKLRDFLRCLFALIALGLALVTGCVSYPPPGVDVAIVTQTLQSYQVGKTTFADFKRDTGLIIGQRPEPAGVGDAQLYYYYLQPPWNPRLSRVYSVPNGSPWRIYGVQHYTDLTMRESSRTERFVVGDINHPISILTFRGDGSLISISDARQF